jgi:hypothetical protein
MSSNPALEFLQFLQQGNINTCTNKCLSLIDLFRTSNIYINKNKIYVTESELPIMYQFKYDKFIKLMNYVETVDVTDDIIISINDLLRSCSQAEFMAYYKILTTPKHSNLSIKTYNKDDLGYCVVQQVPDGSNRLLVKVTESGIKAVRGTLNDVYRKTIEQLFSDTNGYLDFYEKNGILYLHDMESSLPTSSRTLKLFQIRKTKNLQVLTPMFDEITTNSTSIYKSKKMLFKPINGTWKDIYKNF